MFSAFCAVFAIKIYGTFFLNSITAFWSMSFEEMAHKGCNGHNHLWYYSLGIKDGGMRNMLS